MNAKAKSTGLITGQRTPNGQLPQNSAEGLQALLFKVPVKYRHFLIPLISK